MKFQNTNVLLPGKDQGMIANGFDKFKNLTLGCITDGDLCTFVEDVIPSPYSF